jgi:two-component system LytT family sensor kinase
MPWRRIGITTGILLGLAVVLGLTELWQISIRERIRELPYYWRETAFLVLPSWLLLALLAPAILFASERFPLERGRLRISLPIHTIGGILFALVHLSLTVSITILGFPKATFARMMGGMSGTYLVYDVLNYWMIVGVAHAVQYYHSYKEREVLASRLEHSLSAARLQALRGQLNPHFLYNTLNSISTMALKGDQAAVVQTLAKLSDLLRATLDGAAEQIVPLDKELELTDLFLDIQQIRFGPRLRIQKAVDPASADAMVPAMILQPLVENAVAHGIALKPGEGLIEIHTERRDGTVRLEVRDSGPGFPTGAAQRSGIGLANTRQRLEQLYGSGQTLECRNNPVGGAVVTITIPFRPRNEAWTDHDPDTDRRR